LACQSLELRHTIHCQMQLAIFDNYDQASIKPPSGQLLKWIGNKQRFAAEIASHFPRDFKRYFEPFIGSGAVLATVAPKSGVASDVFPPLVEIWKTLVKNPEKLKRWYADRCHRLEPGNKVKVYEEIKASYNANPNGADLLFLCRACYGGVVRFRKGDGFMSTPCGIHDPIPPQKFNRRVDEWHKRVAHIEIRQSDYSEIMEEAKAGDIVYCDPPYSHSQAIIYGAQDFQLDKLFKSIAKCKSRGVFVALSIDGTKKSGGLFCELDIPEGLFENEFDVHCGRSMLKRFQMLGKTLESEEVTDRLLLTY
jgi:DNA adenine methylase